MGRKPFVVLTAPIIFFLDRLSKIYIQRHFAEGEGFSVIPGIFHVTRVNNTGAAFGALPNAGFFLIVVSAVSVAAIAAYLYRGVLARPLFLSHCAWALVAAGAAGNLVDRLSFGYVIDFLDFRIWPVFNVADASICVGVSLVILSSFRRRGPGRVR